MFLNPNNCSNLSGMKISGNKLKKHSVTKNCSDLSLFEQIVPVISKILKILGFCSSSSGFYFSVGDDTILFMFDIYYVEKTAEKYVLF